MLGTAREVLRRRSGRRASRAASPPASAPAQVEVETDMPVVALTFDDGPRSSTTGRLLDELALREVPATFFLLGHRRTQGYSYSSSSCRCSTRRSCSSSSRQG